MMNSVFGELTFHIGWKAPATIDFFGNACPVTLNVKAYFEEDGVTLEQEQAYLAYTKNKEEKFAAVQRLLSGFANDAATRFVPRTLLFERDGSYALLCDDHEMPDEGVAVCLAPMEQIVSQDDYL